MSLLYDWPHRLLMNQDAFLYNTLAHDTTTPHGYQRAAKVGTKSHQHKIKHRNRRNKHPLKIPEKSWYESCEVPRGMNFIWIAFLVVLLEIQRSIRPMSFHATLPSWQGLWPRNGPAAARAKHVVCQWHDAQRLDDSKVICPFEHEVGTHLKCQIPNFLKQFFASLKLPFGPSSGVNFLHFSTTCCLLLVRVQLQKLQVEVEVSSSKENKHTFLLESIDENWYF